MSYSGSRLWNEIPYEIRRVQTLEDFKDKLKHIELHSRYSQLDTGFFSVALFLFCSTLSLLLLLLRYIWVALGDLGLHCIIAVQVFGLCV